jgi:hypothetical protein
MSTSGQPAGLIIEHQCPQCGAPATLAETDHLFSCEFCRVKSYLLTRFFQYVLPFQAQEEKELFFFPYWRFKGVLYSCVSEGVKHRIVDVSQQAVSSRHFPLSLGLRSQTLKLRFVTPEIEGRFLKPSILLKELVDSIEDRFNMFLPKPIFRQTFIGENLSYIYAPFYLNGKVYDAVLNRPVSEELPDDLEHSDGPPDWRIQFIPAMCPNCGWDLEGERDSLLLHCRNCHSAWYPGKSRLKKMKFVCLEGQGEDIYLPFYRIKVQVSGIELESYADLVKVANLPKVVQEEWKEREFYFWSPAFKVRPQDFLNFSRNLTLSQPQEGGLAELPNVKPYPVTLSIEEAAESLEMNLAGFMKPPRVLYPKLPEIEIKPKTALLVYIPFREKGSELSQPAYRLRINKNLLRFARHL